MTRPQGDPGHRPQSDRRSSAPPIRRLGCWRSSVRVVLISLLLWLPAGEAAIALPDAVLRIQPELRLAGQGTLRWYGMHIYDAALWVRDGRFDPAGEFALVIRYARNVPARRLVQTSIAEMRRLGRGDHSALERWAQELAGILIDVRRGERLTGVRRPGAGVDFYHEGRHVGTMTDPEFADAFFSIWLDERTREPGLRRALIGRQ